jgi:hypothetical protein
MALQSALRTFEDVTVRERSYRRFLAFEAQRRLEAFGAETRVFDPRGAAT